jgi:GT2 family glycosyltransferase
MSTLVGIVTFGNLPFTKLAVRSIRETVVKYPFDIFCVVGKPGDIETEEWLKEEGIPHVVHDWNYGFPYSVNDIYDYAWKENDYANLVIMGNDVIAYPYAIDSLIEIAETTDYEWVCSRQYDVKSLTKDYPQIRKYFEGTNLVFKNFDSRPWEVFKVYSEEVVVNPSMGLSDVHNLALFKKSIFDKVGYIDVNFYPAYYEDNDYVRRAIRAGVKSCTVDNSFYFHFWSRTIHQEQGGSNSRFFTLNRNFYIIKWGGDFGQEKYEIPFNDRPYNLAPGLTLQPVLYLKDRTLEKDIARVWKSKGA